MADDRVIEIFRSKAIPAHREIQMKALGLFPSGEDLDTFFFMRGFPDTSSREPMKEGFYEGKLWEDQLKTVLMPMLEKYEVVAVENLDNLVPW
jgi:hypothetical protein